MRTELRNLGLIAAGITGLGTLALPGCSPDSSNAAANAAAAAEQTNSWRMSDSDRAISKDARLASVMDVGNGVFVFPQTYFPQTLSDFREAHPNLTIISISQGKDQLGGSYGYRSGAAENFIVVTSPENPSR